MPDLDTGHIFLTTLAPIKDSNNDSRTHLSFEQNARIALAKMPTALQSPATEKTGVNSPFSRNNRNHLARMFVLDDAVYNGRVGKGAISSIILRENSITPQKVDKLNAPYLVFCAEIDAITNDGDPLPTTLTAAEQKEVRASYARELWDTMELELQDVYSNCYGFENVDTAEQFAEYLEKCHVETTMPFHDYYLTLPEFNNLPLKPILYGLAVPALIAVISLLLWLFGCSELPGLGWSSLWTFIGFLGITIAAAGLLIRYAVKNGEKPLRPAKYDDLPSVLKSIYMQQKFSDFVVDHQGKDDKQLYKAFGAFLKTHKPSDRSGPTQAPGLVSSAQKTPDKTGLIA